MAHTNSLAFPKMFNVAQNTVAVLDDNVAIANRVRLLILTEPTELYNSPRFGVGLRRYIFQYNNENTVAIIQDRIKKQIDMYEPYVNAEKTQFANGLLYTGSEDAQSKIQDYNHLKMTVKLETVYSDSVSIDIDESDKEVTNNE